VGGKSDIYEPALNVPFAVRVPPAYRARARRPVSHAVVANQDVAPTLIDYASRYLGPIETCAGTGDCRRMDGRSLKPLLGGRGHWPSKRGVLAEIDTGRKSYHAVRTHRYVYSALATNEHELYDLKRDPEELWNRDGQGNYAQIEQELASRLAKLRICSGIKRRDPRTAAPFCE
jgi:N-acetylglucosamine-6-sulfatase